MASNKDEYFKVWLTNEVDLAERDAARRQKALDAKAAAEGWLLSGRRIANSIEVISDVCLPLADKAFAEASVTSEGRHYDVARDAVSQLLELLSNRIPGLIAPMSSPAVVRKNNSSNRLMLEVKRRLAQVRKDFETKSEIERARIEAKKEIDAANKVRDEADARKSAEPFGREKRWGMRSVLTWIATRDLYLAYVAAESNETNFRVELRMALNPPENGAAHRYQTLEEAWRLELGPSISDGKIRATGAIVIQGSAQRIAGLVFPPADQPRLADHVEFEERATEIALIPKESDREWRDLVFSTSDVFAIWSNQDLRQEGTTPTETKGQTKGTLDTPDQASKPVSKKQLASDFKAHILALGPALPTRANVRDWARQTYGDRVTTAKADDLYRLDAASRPRRRGRRPQNTRP